MGFVPVWESKLMDAVGSGNKHMVYTHHFTCQKVTVTLEAIKTAIAIRLINF